MNGVLQQIRRAALRHETALTDGQLLESFVTRRDEGAFTALVRRHGPMVMGVCRRLLGHIQDAEDAFQAAFLVLARKGAGILPRDAVGPWLYGVAYRTARKARAMTVKRRLKHEQFRASRASAPRPDQTWEALHPLLDEELSRLPRLYQSAIVLCDLEGKTKKEAARQLGCPEGTLSARLTRGRRMLAKRLTRRGVTLSAGGLALLIAQHATGAMVPAALIQNTGEAAVPFAFGHAGLTGIVSAKVAALTQGVLKTMLLIKLRVALAMLLVLGLLGAGASLFAQRGRAANQGTDSPPMAPAPPDQQAATGNDPKGVPRPVDAVKQELQRLQGTWMGAGGEFRGQGISEEDAKRARHKLVITGDQFTWGTALHEDGNEVGLLKGPIKIDPTAKPKALDLTFVRDGKTVTGKCIYELDGDTLKFCYDEPNRATSFKTSKEDLNRKLYIWKRVAAKELDNPPKNAPQSRIKFDDVFYLFPFTLPTAAEILRLVPAKSTTGDIECELLACHLDGPRFFPLVGPARLAHAHFKCTVPTKLGKQIVYLDRDHLIPSK